MNTAVRRVQDKRHAILLCVCYLSQLVIATAQPFGLPARILIPLFFLSSLVQCILYRLLSRKVFPTSRLFSAATALLLCFAAGYDFVRAERFYRTMTSRQLSFWWIIGCMLLIGWYAACCGRDTVLRAAQPVLAVLLLSLAVLAAVGRYRQESLSFADPDAALIPRAAIFFLEYTFSAELLLWFYWNTHPQPLAMPPQAEEERSSCGPGGWAAAVWLRFAVAAAFVLLGELALGRRMQNTPQVFGVLSLVSAGADAGHGGVLYHSIWLTALAVRVSAVCCTLRELGMRGLPALSGKSRVVIGGTVLVGAAVLWEALWRQNCLAWLSGGVLILVLAAIAFARNAKRERGKERI